ncbi:hypothetical protein D3C76_1213350 [compost metagenome]
MAFELIIQALKLHLFLMHQQLEFSPIRDAAQWRYGIRITTGNERKPCVAAVGFVDQFAFPLHHRSMRQTGPDKLEPGSSEYPVIGGVMPIVEEVAV